ncbi:MAG TPA: hypothetical protein VER96_29860 [Polyangiaceae bacterium]|nr:hypothetical protein [Polyangiaceae bacterium]
MHRIHALRQFAPFLLAICGCSIASAADGSTTTKQTTPATSATPNPVPPSRPADARPPRKPPQEAFDACKSLSEGDACSVSFRGQTMTGTCRKGPNGESELACVPAYPPGPPPSESNETLTDSAMERKLDQLEREIHGS